MASYWALGSNPHSFGLKSAWALGFNNKLYSCATCKQPVSCTMSGANQVHSQYPLASKWRPGGTPRAQNHSRVKQGQGSMIIDPWPSVDFRPPGSIREPPGVLLTARGPPRTATRGVWRGCDKVPGSLYKVLCVGARTTLAILSGQPAGWGAALSRMWEGLLREHRI